MWVTRHGIRHWVGPRPEEELDGNGPVPLLRAEQTARAADAIADQLRADYRAERLAWEQACDRELCIACGCLCLPDEHCPMCLVQRAAGWKVA